MYLLVDSTYFYDINPYPNKFIPQFLLVFPLIHPNPFTPHDLPQEFLTIIFPFESYPTTVIAWFKSL